MILGSLELIAEVYTLAEKAGIGAAPVHQFIKDIMPAPPSVYVSYCVSDHSLIIALFFFRLISYGDKMLHDKFDGSKGFAIDGGLKDSQHIRRLATELDTPMPALVRPRPRLSLYMC